MKRAIRFQVLAAGALALALSGAACGFADPEQPETVNPRYRNTPMPQQSIFGPGGLLGSGREAPQGSVIGVNGFLWRASLDTISFMPLASADPFGGVVITDWYVPPETPNERFKAVVYILSRTLRTDGLRVMIFRQRRGAGGDWTDAAVGADTAVSIENRILERARQLRIAAIGE